VEVLDRTGWFEVIIVRALIINRELNRDTKAKFSYCCVAGARQLNERRVGSSLWSDKAAFNLASTLR